MALRLSTCCTASGKQSEVTCHNSPLRYVSSRITNDMPSCSRTVSLWDAQSVLKIDNMGRCAGWARSRHRNCANPIARHNQQRADNLIEALQKESPDFETLEDDLYQLASLLLCRAVHQNQVDDIVCKWETRLNRFATSQAEEEASRQNRRAFDRASGPRTTITSSTPIPIPSRSLYGSGVSPLPSFQSIPRTSSPDLRVSQEVTDFDAMVRDIVNRLCAIEARRIAAPASSESTTSPGSQRPANATPTTPTCTVRHARRLAIDDECPICHGDFLLRDQDRLVWCKSGCGRTVHQDCFETWKKACEEGDRVVTCGVCRTPWSQDCHCES